MRLLIHNFLTCPSPLCHTTNPTHKNTHLNFKTLTACSQKKIPFNEKLIRNMIPKIEWETLVYEAETMYAAEVLPIRWEREWNEEMIEWSEVNTMQGNVMGASEEKIQGGEITAQDEEEKMRKLKLLHLLLMENRPSNTFELIAEIEIEEGTMQCAACKLEYQIMDGIANMLIDEKQITA